VSVTDLEPVVSVRQLARLWSVHPTTIKRWIRAGDLTAVRVGAQLRVTRESAEAFLRRQNENGPE
jgi:excisionase family DNA binding protein